MMAAMVHLLHIENEFYVCMFKLCQNSNVTLFSIYGSYEITILYELSLLNLFNIIYLCTLDATLTLCIHATT